MPITPSDATHEWGPALDPHEYKAYTAKFVKELEASGAIIATATWTLSDDAIAAGVEIGDESFDEQTATIWLRVNVADQEDNAFNPPNGSDFTVKIHITDSLGQEFERTIKFKVVQR